MPDLADVGLVDAHAEGGGGDDDAVTRFHEAILAALALVARESCVIRLRGESGGSKFLGHHLAVLARAYIDDRGAHGGVAHTVLE